MKKLLAVLFVLIVFDGVVFAEDSVRLKQGNLPIANMSPNEYVFYMMDGNRIYGYITK